jgi:S-methylmethionine-dependent homocysteine/selenocysteine methylase
MARYRNALPQLGGELFLTDGGIETTLIFHEGLDLPHFAAFHLLRDARGSKALLEYFRSYARVARELRRGLILESATWRASHDWGQKLGYSDDELATANRRAVQMLEQVRRDCDDAGVDTVISGCVGPRGDGYVPGSLMSVEEAERYHGAQIRTFAGTAADMICALTMNYPDEATGIVLAARAAKMPVAIAFTVETDGKLPSGHTLRSAIEAVDDATSAAPVYYMINCAHPAHFSHVFAEGGAFIERIRGLRANASRMSHAELNDSPTLDAGDAAALARDYAGLRKAHAGLNILGGCCGTDHRHVEAIGRACQPLFRANLPGSPGV